MITISVYSVYLPSFERLHLETFLFNIIGLYVSLGFALSEIPGKYNKGQFTVGNCFRHNIQPRILFYVFFRSV